MNLVEWYNEQRAAEALGVSRRTIQRLAKDGAIRRAYRNVPGRKQEPVYHPEDVEREKERILRPTPVEDTRPGPEPQSLVIRPSVPEMIDRFAEVMNRGRQAPPLWLPIEAASEYSGLSQALIHRLIAAGKLAAIGDAAIKVRRTDLETLDTATLAEAAPLERLRGRTKGLPGGKKHLLLNSGKKNKSM
jgi:hypothetical protein